MGDDGEIWLAIGLAAALLVVITGLADRRQVQRSNPDAVGWMPWTALYFLALMVACIALGLAARAWLREF